MGHWPEEFGTCQPRGGKRGKSCGSELHTWLSHQHPQDTAGFAGRTEPGSIPNARAIHGGGGWGCVCSSDLASTSSHCPVFFSKEYGAVSMAIGDFLLVAFLHVMVSKHLLKMQDFKGSLDFPAWKATSSWHMNAGKIPVINSSFTISNCAWESTGLRSIYKTIAATQGAKELPCTHTQKYCGT